MTSDPGLLRLRSALRTTLAVAATAGFLGLLFAWHDLPLLAPAAGTVLAMMGTALPREPAPRARVKTVLLMAVTAGASLLLAAVLSRVPGLAEVGLLAVLFLAVMVQPWGPRAIALGLTAVVNVYLALFLRADPAHAVTALAAIPVAVAIVLLVGYVLIPERPARALARVLRNVEHRGADLLREMAGAGAPDATAQLRGRQRFAALNDTILFAEDQLSVIAPEHAVPVSHALTRLELALANIAAVAGTTTLARDERARLRLAAIRLSTGRWPGRAMAATRPDTALVTALRDLERAARDLVAMAAAASATSAPPVRPAAPPRPPLTWRPAVRATTAAALSMVGGYALSPDRWFWALLTAYLVFLGARSRGDAVHKGLQRVWGTVVGLVAGLLVSVALSGHPYLEVAGILVCVFGLAYVFAISQTIAIFCVTVLLGLVYSLVGANAGAILVLRLEETAIGAAAAIGVGLVLFPRGTRDHLRDTGAQLLGALAVVARLGAARLGGDRTASPVLRMRGADRLMRDLRAALRPLQAGRMLVWWAQRPAELPAILACIFWMRVLASETEATTETDPALAARMTRLADRFDAVARPGTEPTGPQAAEPPAALDIGTAHVGQTSAALLGTTLDNVEAVLDLLADRLRSDGWDALVTRRPL